MAGAGHVRASAARLAAALIAVLVCLWPVAAPAAGAAGPDPRPLTVVMDDNYPPFVFRDGAGTLQGILIDSWAAWSRRTGVPVDLKAMDWDLALKAMAEGRADVIDTIFRTAARERTLEFTPPYATLEVPIFFDAALSGIAGVDSLRGFAVGVKAGDACADWLTERGITDLRRFPSYERLVTAAIEREVLVFCMDAPPATYFLSKHGALDRFRTTAALYTGQFHRAVRRGDRATLDLVAGGFDRIPEAERQEIENRWYGRALRMFGWTEFFRQFAPIIAAALGAGVLLLAWTWTLHRQVAARTRRLSEALDDLGESEERFRAIVDNVSDAIFIHDADTGAIVFVNRRMREMYGAGDRPLDDIDVGTLSEGAPPYSLVEARGWMERALRGETPVFEWHARRLDGRTFWVEVGIRRARIGPHDRLLVVVRDISERMAHQERLHHLAHHDPLTGLPNRLLLADRVEQAVQRAAQAGEKVALVFSDLDQFKTINDSLGHHAGDTLIREAARRLSGCIRHTDIVGRLGGDEFIVLLGGVADADAAAHVVQTLHAAIARPFEIDGQEITATLSSGIALYPDDGRDFGALLKKADTAMHQAKAEGRNTHRFFSERMHQDSLGRLTMRTGLRRALENGEFVLHYQPQVEIASGRMVGVEALLRWVSPDRGLVPPAAFIPTAEDSGLIVPIGEWVLREACRQAAAWSRDGRALSVAVNISAVQFHRPGLEETVLAALADSGLPPDRLELELTESVLLRDTEAALARVRRLGECGLKLSIDDFGTGYSSLAYIRSLEVDKLKIDRSFVRDVGANAGSAAIATAIIQMSHSLGLIAVAEGVETEAELAFLRGQNCDIAQGYLIARPLPADQLVF